MTILRAVYPVLARPEYVTKHLGAAHCALFIFSTCSPLLCTPAMYLHTQVIPTFASGSPAPKASCAVVLEEPTLTSSPPLGIDHNKLHRHFNQYRFSPTSGTS